MLRDTPSVAQRSGHPGGSRSRRSGVPAQTTLWISKAPPCGSKRCGGRAIALIGDGRTIDGVVVRAGTDFMAAHGGPFA
jgi:hypothetical protein